MKLQLTSDKLQEATKVADESERYRSRLMYFLLIPFFNTGCIGTD